MIIHYSGYTLGTGYVVDMMIHRIGRDYILSFAPLSFIPVLTSNRLHVRLKRLRGPEICHGVLFHRDHKMFQNKVKVGCV